MADPGGCGLAFWEGFKPRTREPALPHQPCLCPHTEHLPAHPPPLLSLGRQLFSAINRRVDALCRALESEVSEGLALGPLALAPADMRLQPPTAEQFHASLADLFARGGFRACVCCVCWWWVAWVVVVGR